MNYRLLDEFQKLFDGKQYKHRDSSLGDWVAHHLYEDLFRIAKSTLLCDRIAKREHVQGIRRGAHSDLKILRHAIRPLIRASVHASPFSFKLTHYQALASASSALEAVRSSQGELPPATTTLVRAPGKRPAISLPKTRPALLRSEQTEDFDLSKCARALLGVLTQRRGIKTTLSQLAILSGYSLHSSGFQNSVSTLRVRELLQGSRDDLRATNVGVVAAGIVETLPTGRALLEYWCSKLGTCERTLLKAIHYHRKLSRDLLCEITGYSANSSGFQNSLSKLRVLELVKGQRGEDVEISEVFDE